MRHEAKTGAPLKTLITNSRPEGTKENKLDCEGLSGTERDPPLTRLTLMRLGFSLGFSLGLAMTWLRETYR